MFFLSDLKRNAQGGCCIFQKIWLDWWTISFDRKHFTGKNLYHQYERREAVQQQPNILFVTGKYRIYIPIHCFQFAYATQSLVFN